MSAALGSHNCNKTKIKVKLNSFIAGVCTSATRNSSRDEIAKVNFLYDIVHVAYYKFIKHNTQVTVS